MDSPDKTGEAVSELMESPQLQLAIGNLFQNDDILFHLFSVLPLKDLLVCRLVSKQWNRISLHFLTNLTKIHINYPAKMAEFLDTLEASNYQTLLSKQFFLSSIYMDHPLTNWFFTLCGKTMTSLKLCIRDDHQMTIETLEHLLLNQVPFLQTLEISLPGGIENQDRLFHSESLSSASSTAVPTLPCMKSLRLCNTHGYNQGFLHDLFSATINLTHLKALLDNNTSGDRRSVILTTLETTGLHRQINKLELESIVTESHFQSLIHLSRMGMKLKTLVFTQLHPRYFDKGSLQLFLLSQRESLEYFKVDTVPAQYYWEDQVNLTLAQMTHLKDVTISGQSLPLPACQFTLYDFVVSCPSEALNGHFDKLDAKLRKMKKKAR